MSGFSLQAQRERLEAFARSQGWTVAGWYVDEGASAKDMNRPAFQRMLREAGAGDIVLVYKLDRLTRSVRDLEDLLQTFAQRGIAFRSVAEQFDTSTAAGRLFLRMVTEIAQWERETISERTAMGKQKKAASGEWAGGLAPFGYAAEPSGRAKAGRTLLQLVPDPLQAPVVRAIFSRYLSGHGLRAICTWLNHEQGARTARGALFRVTSLSRILTNPIYCGDVVHGRRTGGAVTRAPGTHPPLVTRETFAQVQAMLAQRRTAAPRQATGAYPLAGIARCGVCGGRIDALKRRSRTGAATYVYRCRNYVNGTGCGNGAQKPLSGVSGTAVEARFAAALDQLPRPARLAEFLARCAAELVRAPDPGEQDARRLEQDLARAQQAVRRWDQAYESGQLDWDGYLERTGPHRARIATIRARLAVLQGQAPAAPAAGQAPAVRGRAPATPGAPPRAPGQARVSLAPGDLTIASLWAFMAAPERRVVAQGLVQGHRLQVLCYPDRRVELRPAD